MSTRLYKVTVAGQSPRLVEANNQAQAVRHVAKGMISAEPAKALDAAKLFASGVVTEVA